MNIFTRISLIIVSSILMALPVLASDSAKEERWANQVTDFLLDGEPQWLEVNGIRFLSIYTPATTEKTIGAIILLHGRGAHPDWPEVIQPLRSQFPEKGWATLSLQMPVLANEAFDKDYIPLFNEIPQRIKAGMNFLSQQNINNIVLMGHSLGATMATSYLASHSDDRIKAFVGIGMKAMKQTDKYHVLDNALSLQNIKIPVLDIYGSKTIEEILYSADRRAQVIKRTGHTQSRQVKMKGTGHFFQGFEEKLVDSIVDWMNEAT